LHHDPHHTIGALRSAHESQPIRPQIGRVTIMREAVFIGASQQLDLRRRRAGVAARVIARTLE